MSKNRPRLVPKEHYQATNVNLWVDDKESDITSVSSASSEESDGETMESSTATEMEDQTIDRQEEEESLDDDDDDDDMESTVVQTLEHTPTDVTKESHGAPFSEEEEDEEMTQLYKAITSEEWDSVLAYLESGSWGWKWSSLCDQLYHVKEKSVEEQVRTWVTTNKSELSKTEIRRLPLHAAVAKGAPFKVIEALIMHFSQGTQNPDSQGNYALHLAFERGLDIETVTFLLQDFPEAIHIQNNAGKVPAECGATNNALAKLVQLAVDATKVHVENELTKEKGNLEEDRKQLLEVTKELMNLKKIVAERERNMTKDNFLYQKQHLNSAIAQLTKLKTDLDRHEGNVLQQHLVADKKRMDGVLGELQKTKGELEMIKSEKNHGGELSAQQQQRPTTPVAGQKKKTSRKSKKERQKSVAVEPPTEREGPTGPNEAITKERDETENTQITSSSQRDAAAGIHNWQSTSMLTMDTNEQPHYAMEASVNSPSSHKSEGRSPKKMTRNVALRFKKKMNWRKEKQQLAADNE